MVADRDCFGVERGVEEAVVQDDPDLECREITDLYRSKGFSGQLLDQVVGTITANRDRWVGTILEDERHLQPVGNSDVLRRSLVITVPTLMGHLLRLVPVVCLPRSLA